MLSKLKSLLDFKLYKKLFSYSKGARKQIIIITIIMFITSILGVFIALSMKNMVDLAIGGNTEKAILYGLIFGGLMIFEILFSAFSSYYTTKSKEVVKQSIQLDLLKSIYNKSWGDINQFKTGDILTRLYNDVASVINSLMSTLPNLISLGFKLIIAFAVLSIYDPILASLTFLVTPVTIFFGMVIGRYIKNVQKKMQEVEATKKSLVNESVQNLLVLKTFDFLKKNIEKFKGLQDQYVSLVKEKNLISVKSNVMLSFGYRLGFFAAMVFGAYRLANGDITVGTLTVFLQLVGQIQGPIHGLAHSIPQLIASFSSLERIESIHDLENEWDFDGEIEKQIKPIKIEFNNLGFSYKKDQSVLKQCSLNIGVGEKIAIIGSSGAGKTTLIHLLLALYKPNSGNISIVGSDESIEISPGTRQYFSYVPQVNSLFSGSIYDNFLLQHEVSQEDIDTALTASCCKEFVDELPDGLNTLMGERGIGLSQGQAQRITIARALLHNTPFLVFDEATSALDLETEKQLIENLKIYYPECTLIAVTHRESLFDICDQVYRLENGRLTHVV